MLGMSLLARYMTMLHNVLWLDLNFDVHSCSHLKGWFGTLISSLVVGSVIVGLNQPLCISRGKVA